MTSVYENGGLIGPIVDAQKISTQFEFVGTPIASGTSVSSMNLPSGLQENDIVFVCGFKDSSIDPAVPTGFTSTAASTGDGAHLEVTYKVMGASPDSEATGLTNDTDCEYYAFAIRGQHVSVPFGGTSEIAQNTTGQPNPPSINIGFTDCLILAIGHLDDDLLGSPNEPPTGYTTLEFRQFGSAGAGGSYAVAYKTVNSIGTEDPDNFNFGTGLGDAWAAATVALRPAGAGLGAEVSGSGMFTLDFVYNKLVSD